MLSCELSEMRKCLSCAGIARQWSHVGPG